MKLNRRSVKRGRIEIIPMIDTILILLIFYMSFSSLEAQEKQIEAKLPLVSTKVAPTKVPLDIVLHVNSEDDIIVNGTTRYDMYTLRDAMMGLSAIGQEVTIVIEANPETSYQDVIRALDACAQANLTKVAFRPLQQAETAAAPAS